MFCDRPFCSLRIQVLFARLLACLFAARDLTTRRERERSALKCIRKTAGGGEEEGAIILGNPLSGRRLFAAVAYVVYLFLLAQKCTGEIILPPAGRGGGRAANRWKVKSSRLGSRPAALAACSGGAEACMGIKPLTFGPHTRAHIYGERAEMCKLTFVRLVCQQFFRRPRLMTWNQILGCCATCAH